MENDFSNRVFNKTQNYYQLYQLGTEDTFAHKFVFVACNYSVENIC